LALILFRNFDILDVQIFIQKNILGAMKLENDQKVGGGWQLKTKKKRKCCRGKS